MAGTRSSARLANAKGKEIQRIKDEEVDESTALDGVSVKAESEYDQSDDDECQSRPPRKRQRTSIKPERAQTRKKQVRGKQGGLAGLVNMPIDIFTEITAHLPPIDIISLSRANKFFRKLLMDRSAIHIWHTSMRNVRGLPPCPSDLSEPHYLALLFSKHCTMCGQAVRCRMDEILRVRLCVPCREEHLLALDNLQWELRRLVHHSGKIVPSKRRWGPESEHTLKEEAREVEQKYQELKDANDPSALTEWELQTRSVVEKRLEEATAIRDFLDIIENDREHEIRDMKRERRRNIEDRLIKLGWTKEDMQFSFMSPKRKEWYSLVEQAKPLTERIWSNIQPKLIPILEYNREARLKKELSDRQSARRMGLVQLLNDIKKNQAPILDISVRAPTHIQGSSTSELSGDSSAAGPSNSAELQSENAPQSTPASGGSDSVAEPPAHTVFRDIFPDIVDALEWPMVKALHEADTSVSQMIQSFAEHKSEIEASIVDWKVDIHARMAEMLRKDEDVGGESLTSHLIVRKDDSDPFQNLSDDLKLLLRADSLFTSTQPNTQKNMITSYDMAIAKSGYRFAFRDGMMSRPYKPPVELTRIRVYTEARRAARIILASMGLENACAAELRSVGRVYACARCHDSGLKTWEELVSHFVEAKEVVARVHEHADKLEALELTYRDVHDPEAFLERPLVKYTPEQSGVVIPIRTCSICSKDPIIHDVRGTEAKIIEHLQDVHDIAEPKFGTHYSNCNQLGPYGFSAPFHFDLDIDPILFHGFMDSESDMGMDIDGLWDDDLW
ncbi:unnamed protein product [Rhizoctonia solani]|uniref:F-box domain-containing protein n=1 Tax=Rhizoctonia solani TaxID=456999 RepID=A0A8H3GJC5_9AGAM|nr:unnamed protein product [Rhizoctonia solani]